MGVMNLLQLPSGLQDLTNTLLRSDENHYSPHSPIRRHTTHNTTTHKSAYGLPFTMILLYGTSGKLRNKVFRTKSFCLFTNCVAFIFSNALFFGEHQSPICVQLSCSQYLIEVRLAYSPTSKRQLNISRELIK